MANTNPAEAWKAEANNGRQPVGTSVVADFSNASANPGNGKLRARGGANPDSEITAGGPVRKQGRVGAQHRITASLPGPSGEAQATQANGKILPPTHSRSGSFYVQGVYDSQGR